MSAAGQGRDFRLDFFRGLALFAIFIDHIPNNPVGYLTLRGFALADAAEVFIFISGYTAAMVYGRKLLRDGALLASALIWRRAWQLYLTNICLFVLYAGQVAYTLRHYNNPLFADELGVGDFLGRPDETILQVLLLMFQPALLDILPLYIALLLVFPLFMLAMRAHFALALLPSAALWTLTQLSEINLPSSGGEWFFNPFAWQFLFVIGACLGFAQARGVRLPARESRRARLLLLGAALVVALGAVIQISWTLHAWSPRIPGLFLAQLHPIHKSLLPPPRLASILALALLVGIAIRRDAAFMTSRWGWPVVLCGQHSLHVFCLGILLSLLGNTILTIHGHGWLMLAVVNLGGIALMIGLASLSAWFDGGGHFPARPTANPPSGATPKAAQA